MIIDRVGSTVTVERGACVDLGGIGKGLAADLVAELLRAAPGVLGVLALLDGADPEVPALVVHHDGASASTPAMAGYLR